MNETRRRYAKKCKIRQVTFYTNETDMLLYKYSKSINFQDFVKNALKNAYAELLINGGAVKERK